MGGGGGKQPKHTTQTIINQPAPWQAPGLKAGGQAAVDWFNNPPPFKSYLAPFTSNQQQGMNMALQAANSILPQLATSSANAQQNLFNAIDVTNNPYLDKAVTAAIDTGVTRPLFEDILPQYTGGSVAVGQEGGGTRKEMLDSIAIRGATEAAGNIASQMYSDAYKQGLNAVSQGLLHTPTVQNAALAPSSVYSSVGGQEQAMEQALLGELQAYEDPAMRIQRLMAMLGAPTTGSSTSTGTNPNYVGSNPIAGAIGGAALAGTLAPAMGLGWGTGTLAAPGPWMPYTLAAGALLGALT